MISPERKRTDALAAQIERGVTERKAAREPEEMPPVYAEMRIPEGENREALQALMRNALSSPGDTPLTPAANVQIVGVSNSLERDGCDFVKMSYLFLSILECPKEARDLVLAVCALSGGDSSDYHIMTDAQVSELIGYDRHVIKKKREILIRWQYETDIAVIDVKENERDPVTRNWLPTEYRARIVPVIAQFVRRARTVRTKNQHFAQKNTIERGYTEIVKELSSDLPTSPVIKRREQQQHKTFPKPKERQQTLLNGEMEQLIKRNVNFLRRCVELKVNPFEMWSEISREVGLACFEMTKNKPEFTE